MNENMSLKFPLFLLFCLLVLSYWEGARLHAWAYMGLQARLSKGNLKTQLELKMQL